MFHGEHSNLDGSGLPSNHIVIRRKVTEDGKYYINFTVDSRKLIGLILWVLIFGGLSIYLASIFLPLGIWSPVIASFVGTLAPAIGTYAAYWTWKDYLKD